jgi:nicotinate-nucleotide--dimethylbenzimidazole phosphoribosyltransferase
VTIAVFAGNHGIAARGVSAFPPEVTAQMVANFAAGGAAINQIATLAGAELRVVPLELERPTRDFTLAAAMDTEDFLSAVDTGCRAVTDDCDLLVVGEMGIANTTTAATLCAALLGGGAGRWAGRGTGVDDDGLTRKVAAIEAALKMHERILGDPLAVAAALGGRELAAISGAVLAARQHGVPVLLDGFVATSAALPLARLSGGMLDHCRAGHVSAESGHRDLLRELKLDPLLDLQMRLGEASGAGVAILLLRAALACHNGMATFAEAGVSGAGDG